MAAYEDALAVSCDFVCDLLCSCLVFSVCIHMTAVMCVDGGGAFQVLVGLRACVRRRPHLEGQPSVVVVRLHELSD